MTKMEKYNLNWFQKRNLIKHYKEMLEEIEEEYQWQKASILKRLHRIKKGYIII